MNARRKILLVFGTRPEAIKMAPLCHALRAAPDFETLICVTAQHREMLDQVLNIFAIRPDIDLNIMRPGQDLFDVTTHVLLGMRDALREHSPEAMLVHGDTTTAMTAAIAGFYAGVPVGHVEAGLRTYDLRAPFPEEFNRQIVSKVTRWHFAPTELNRSNLLAEKVDPAAITITGNTVIDALFWMLDQIKADPARAARIDGFLGERLSFDWGNCPFVLITGHRRENFGDGFLQICQALKDLARRHQDIHFVYPVHLNPNVQKPVNEILAGQDNVHLLAPLDYEPFVRLLQHCRLVLTDSGGVQEEAPSLGKPVLVMRNVTERPEAIAAGTVKLVGADHDRIVTGVSELLDSEASYNAMARAHNPYGDGQACGRICDVLRNLP
ncbi:MAG: UDP-N-acetylglucosamine 2-epimerase (non-hydrolyzing) [Alphaproteobacteria bacterium]|nr:UDP-N-acetylglucosamine 2-epimerase (non-hydrolyzing) [Alphaproteobacteria bacterium]